MNNEQELSQYINISSSQTLRSYWKKTGSFSGFLVLEAVKQ
jgi:hypothetical protein